MTRPRPAKWSETISRMHGFTVTLCDGGKSLRQAIAQATPDLVVLDLNMPEEDGLSIVRDLKSRTTIPVIMLTATASPIDRVVGLELGADDYIAKPGRTARASGARALGSAPKHGRKAGGAGRSPAPEPAATVKKIRFGTKWLDTDARALRDDDGNEHPLTAVGIWPAAGVCGQPEARSVARAAARTGQCPRQRGL